jgi:hypothetical protein
VNLMDAGPWMTGNFPGERVAAAPVELPPSPTLSIVVALREARSSAVQHPAPVQKSLADVVHRSSRSHTCPSADLY